VQARDGGVRGARQVVQVGALGGVELKRLGEALEDAVGDSAEVVPLEGTDCFPDLIPYSGRRGD